MILTVTDGTFARDVLSSRTPVVVDFFTKWCKPCEPLGVMLQELAAEFGGRVAIAKVDAEACPEVTARYGVRGFPTLLIFRDGQVQASHSGALARQKLKSWIEQNL